MLLLLVGGHNHGHKAGLIKFSGLRPNVPKSHKFWVGGSENFNLIFFKIYLILRLWGSEKLPELWYKFRVRQAVAETLWCGPKLS